MSVTIAAVEQQKLFDNIRKLKDLLETLNGLGLDFAQLGKIGEMIMETIAVVRDEAATAATKVGAVVTLLEKIAATTTGIAWDDKMAAAARSLEPLIVKLINAIGVKEDDGTVSVASAPDVAAVVNDSFALAFDPMTLFAIAKMIWDVIQLFLKRKE